MANDVTKDRSPESDIVEDIYLWRRKKLALTILSVSTATWVLLNIYGFNSITIVSWTAIAIVSMVFLWGNLLLLLSKVEPELSGLEVSEEFVAETHGEVLSGAKVLMLKNNYSMVEKRR